MNDVRSDVRHLKEYARNILKRDELKQQLAETDEALKRLEQPVLSYFERQGIDRTTIEGVTLFVRRDLWAKYAENITRDAVIARLSQFDETRDFVQPNVSLQRISSFLRELDAEGRPLPEAFQGYIERSESFKVGYKKG